MGPENTIRVTNTFGAGSWLGFITPAVGMVTDKGTITSLTTGNLLASVSGAGVSVPQQFYPHQLFAASGAMEAYGWPTGVNCVRWGRNQVWPNGVPVIPGTGMYFDAGDSIISFSR